MAAEQSAYSAVEEAACCASEAASVLREYSDTHGDRAFSAIARLIDLSAEELFKLDRLVAKPELAV